jgi:hypothetical protein
LPYSPFLGGLALSFVIAGIVTVCEATYTFRDTEGMLKSGWPLGACGFLIAGVGAASVYTILWMVLRGFQVQAEHTDVSPIGLALFVVSSLQIVRVPAFARANLAGVEQPSAKNESAYYKGQRTLYALMLRRYLNKIEKQSVKCSMLNRVLPAVYTLGDATREFKGCIQPLKGSQKREAQNFLTDTELSENFTDEQRCEILMAWIVARNTELAVYLAGRRTSAIVERELYK